MCHARQGQLAFQRRRDRGKGRHPGDHVVGYVQRRQAPHLLADGAVEGGVAGMQARDVVSQRMGGDQFRDDLVEGEGGRVDDLRIRRRRLDHRCRYQTAGVEADRAALDQPLPAHGYQIRRPRPRADEEDGHATAAFAGP